MHENVHFFIEHFSYSRRYFFLDVAFYPARFPISQSRLASSAVKNLFSSFVFLQKYGSRWKTQRQSVKNTNISSEKKPF